VIGAEGEIGEQQALALAWQRHLLTAGKHTKLEAAKQAERPARRPFNPFFEVEAGSITLTPFRVVLAWRERASQSV
jgi:hypothetical protein